MTLAGAGGSAARFDELQAQLVPLFEANRPGSGVEHVLVILPSYSVGESLLSHYADRIPALEHRFLLATLMLGRIESCEVVFVSSEPPGHEVLDYYWSLLPPERQASARARFRFLTVPDRSARPVAAKLLERPDLLDELRASLSGRPALIEPWNVTEAEVEVACRIGAAINGTAPALRGLGFKSAGRRLFARAGVPTPVGREDVRTVDDVVDAIAAIRAARPGLPGVVIKHDDSGAGDGNVVVDLLRPSRDGLRARLAGLPDWYLTDLHESGGVVEELVTGEWCSSPSAQLDIQPTGRVVVLSTHEQVLGGDSGQVYTGCRFPAHEAYAAEIARHAAAVGEELAREGAVGRAGIDFVAARDRAGRWKVAALEINLRKGGTTHTYSVLRNLVPGRYDADAGRWVCAEDGTPRAYVASDNVVDSGWRGLPPAAVVRSVADANLQFDHRTGTGVVVHMLSCLAIDGRFGMTAVGRSPEHAEELYIGAVAAVAGAALRRQY